MQTRNAYAPGTFRRADLSTGDAGGARSFYGKFVVVADPAGAMVCHHAGEMDD